MTTATRFIEEYFFQAILHRNLINGGVEARLKIKKWGKQVETKN